MSYYLDNSYVCDMFEQSFEVIENHCVHRPVPLGMKVHCMFIKN